MLIETLAEYNDVYSGVCENCGATKYVLSQKKSDGYEYDHCVYVPCDCKHFVFINVQVN
jgi:uncharacterized metal-binding protein